MNPRIRQLAEQATSIVEMTGPQGYASQYANFDREKFAELIVRECADIDFRHKIGLSSDQDYEVSNTIKQHFGVTV